MLREIYCSPRAGMVTMLLNLPPLRTVPSDKASSHVELWCRDHDLSLSSVILVVSEREIMELSVWRSRSLKDHPPPGTLPSSADIQLKVTFVCVPIYRFTSGIATFYLVVSYIMPSCSLPILLSSLSSLPSLLHLDLPRKHHIVIEQPGHHQKRQLQELEYHPQSR